MARQIDFDFSAPIWSDLDADWARFHKETPGVYRELLRLTRSRIHAQRLAGKEKPYVSIKSLFEEIRPRFPGLNNNYTSRYARHLMVSEPDLRGVFRTRGLRS